MTHTPKKRVHFRISCEALARLDELVKLANKTMVRPGVITRSDIADQLILKHTKNSLVVIDEEIERLALKINRLQAKREVLAAEKEKRGI